jgi:hypothetical protein
VNIRMTDPSPRLVSADPAVLVGYGTRTAPLEARVAAMGRELLAVDAGTDPVVAAALAPANALGTALVALGSRGAALAEAVVDAGLALAAADRRSGPGPSAGWAAPVGGWQPGDVVPEALLELALDHPEQVGPVDGMPPAARYVANRALARRERDAALAAGDHDRAARFAALAAPGRRLLLLDPTGDGRVAEVFGADPDTADHVAVVVPGMLSTLANHEDELRVKGEDLAAGAAAVAPDRRTSVVAWLGYDAPGVLDAPLDDDARVGAPALVAFVDGLRATGTDDVTVVGHSYGSVVTGAALLAGLDADRVVVTGSPGMLVDHADDLGPTPVYALRAPLDVVSWTEAFGRDPSDPRFGATRLDANGAGHLGYLEPGTVAAAAVAAVVTDQSAAAPVDPAHPYEVAAGVLDDIGEAGAEARDDAADALGEELDRILDDLERELPGPLGDTAGAWRDRVGTALEYGERATGFADRLTSPDLWVDVALDVDDLIPDEEIERGLVAVATGPASPLGWALDQFDEPLTRRWSRGG